MSQESFPTLWVQQLDYAATREEAATHIVDEYTGQLLALIRSRLSQSVRAKVDECEILQSVWGSFFRGGFDIRDRHSLFSLLVVMCVNKSCSAARLYTGSKRNTAREVSVTPEEYAAGKQVHSADSPVRIRPQEDTEATGNVSNVVEYDSLFDRSTLELMAIGATGDQAAVVIDLIESLPPELQEILQMRLEGLTETEIAGKLGCVRRTITRRLGLIRDHFQTLGRSPM